MTNNDQITTLEARIATLEAVPPCACLDCQASRKRRISESAILQQLAIERSPDAIAQVRRMPLRDQAMFWRQATDERAIELLTGPDVADEERDTWIGFKLSVRDRVELELVELPPRVRVRLVAEMRYTPSRVVVNEDNARKLQSVGLGERLVHVHDVIEFVPLQVTKDFSPVVERRHLDAMIKIDTQLADCLTAGEIAIHHLSEIENKAIEVQIWHDFDFYSRPKRPRKKLARSCQSA